MSTLDKIEYLNETKENIKEILNSLFNLEISNNDTFRSYITKINELYLDYPEEES